jgi:uncharacterized protein YndB with AHSA1/START domain
MDVSSAGSWKHNMHGPDGTDYPNVLTYVEVVKPERLTYRQRAAKKARRKLLSREP